MKSVLLVSALSIMASSAFAEPTCTTEDSSKWMAQDAFKQQLMDQGYEIKKFKETKGHCYELYGYDSQKRRVEIYLNPVNGDAVKTEIDG